MTFWQGGDLLRFEAVHAETFVDRSAAGRTPDRLGFRKGVERLYGRFPDFTAVVEFIAVDDAMGLATIRWSATARLAEDATTFEGIEIIRCQANRVVERWGEWDGGVT